MAIKLIGRAKLMVLPPSSDQWRNINPFETGDEAKTMLHRTEIDQNYIRTFH